MTGGYDFSSGSISKSMKLDVTPIFRSLVIATKIGFLNTSDCKLRPNQIRSLPRLLTLCNSA